MRLALFPAIIVVSVMVFTFRLWQLQVAPRVEKERPTAASRQKELAPSFLDRAKRKLSRMMGW